MTLSFGSAKTLFAMSIVIVAMALVLPANALSAVSFSSHSIAPNQLIVNGADMDLARHVKLGLIKKGKPVTQIYYRPGCGCGTNPQTTTVNWNANQINIIDETLADSYVKNALVLAYVTSPPSRTATYNYKFTPYQLIPGDEAPAPDPDVAPSNSVAPVVSGTAGVGETLTTTSGTWTGTTPMTYTYQWLRDGNPITGATSSSYTLVEDDEDAMISVSVTATNGAGTSGPVTSNAIGPIEDIDVTDLAENRLYDASSITLVMQNGNYAPSLDPKTCTAAGVTDPCLATSFDGGATFPVVTGIPAYSNIFVNHIDRAKDGAIWTLDTYSPTQKGLVRISLDGGATWTEHGELGCIDTGGFDLLRAISATHAYYTNQAGTCNYYTVDAGDTWLPFDSLGTTELTMFHTPGFATVHALSLAAPAYNTLGWRSATLGSPWPTPATQSGWGNTALSSAIAPSHSRICFNYLNWSPFGYGTKCSINGSGWGSPTVGLVPSSYGLDYLKLLSTRDAVTVYRGGTDPVDGAFFDVSTDGAASWTKKLLPAAPSSGVRSPNSTNQQPYQIAQLGEHRTWILMMSLAGTGSDYILETNDAGDTFETPITSYSLGLNQGYIVKMFIAE